MKDKTIIITAPYFPPQGGGLERYAQEVATRLSRDFSWRVVIVTSDTSIKDDKKEIMEDMTIYRLKPDIRISNTPISLTWVWKIQAIIDEEKPDVINIHTPVPGLGYMASLAGRKIPQVVTYHTGSMKKGNFLDPIIYIYERFLLRPMLQRAKTIICSSDFVREGFLADYDAKSVTITPGVDCTLFHPGSEEDAGAPSLIFIAKMDRGTEYKGLATLLEAMKILGDKGRNIRLDVIGDGEMRSGYERYARTIGLGDKVIFHGSLQGQVLAEEYKKAGIFVLPTSNDSQPLVLLEAMASGLAIISTRIGGIPKMVADGKEALLISPKQPQLLAESIVRLLDDEDLRQRLGKNARERAVEAFDWQNRLNIYNDILQQATQQHL